MFPWRVGRTRWKEVVYTRMWGYARCRCAWSDGDVRIRNELTGAWLMDVAGGSLCLQPAQQSRRIHTNRLTCRSWWRPEPRSHPSFKLFRVCLLYSWSDVTKRHVAFLSRARISRTLKRDYTLIKREFERVRVSRPLVDHCWSYRALTTYWTDFDETILRSKF